MNKRVSRTISTVFLLVIAGSSFAQPDAGRRFSIVGADQGEPSSMASRKTGVYARVSADLVGLQQEYDAYSKLLSQ